MISYLEGKLKKVLHDRLMLLVGGVGYEVMTPAYVMDEIKRSGRIDAEVALYISYNQTERQPKPVLVGFLAELEKEFFELFISVEDIGPAAAVRALDRPAGDIARWIEAKDIKSLKKLKGIGERKAEKIVATLKGKVAKYALMRGLEEPITAVETEDFTREVESVLVQQLGHKTTEARKLIAGALKRNPAIATSEALFEEVYRGQKQ